ncbi:MAG: plastocyanin/azurin family copper-binding protein [Chloroflexi bacterium]|nr:plastocyanin/azurin family copper-binding protein [Chloroflexota bacterium]
MSQVWGFKRLWGLGGIVAALVIAMACSSAAPAAAPASETPVGTQADAMMDKEGDTMEKTGEAMMEKEGDSMTKSDDAMMGKEGDKMEKTGDAMMMEKLPDQKFAAHFVDSAPAHGDAFALVPERVVINFDFTLHSSSSIQVMRDDVPVQTGPVTLGERNLSMSVTLPDDAGNGVYHVTYRACWPDTSCHDGEFGFTVDSAAKASYLDMSGKAEVQIDMSNIAFQSDKIIVSSGAKVVWVNRDGATHFVNADPHPSHNSLPGLNSLEIKTGESFGFTFSEPGEYAYHCSAHVPQNMVGRIIVI